MNAENRLEGTLLGQNSDTLRFSPSLAVEEMAQAHWLGHGVSQGAS